MCFVATFCFVSLACAADQFDQRDFQTDASFELVVSKSEYLRPGASKITSQSAYVSLAHGLTAGNADGLEVMFFSRPVTQASVPDLMSTDASEMRTSAYAAMVLFLDKNKKVAQANLSYVVPGTTVARTVAWKPDELKRYFSDMTFTDGRLVLKSAGSYSEADSAQEVFTLTWDIDLDLPVVREVQR